MTIVPSSGGWIGTTSNWNTASNWCNSTVPISTTDVSISTGVANMPQMTAASNCRDLIINPGATVTINGANTLSIFGSLTDNGTFTTNNSSVTFSGVAQQTIGGTSPIIFNNLTINNSSVISPQILTTNFINVNNAFTMTTGDINLSSYNLTVGTAAGSAGSLTWSAGKLFIGNLTRWFNTSTIAVGNVSGLFPVGSSADYRPFYIGYTSALTTGGTIRVGHTNAATTSVVSFADGGSTVVRRQDSFWTVATGNGLSVGATPFNVRAEGTGFGTVGAVTDLRLVRVGDVTGIGTSAASAGTTSNPQVNRTGLAVAGLTNNFYIGSINAVNSPLPITLLSFTGKRVPSGVELNWKTAQEINNDRFEIEQSLDGYEFSKVGTLNGFGNSNQVHEYKFIDKEVLLTSRYYYRLRQVDYNGTAHFSNTIVALALSELGPQWAVFPNPSSSDHPLQVRLTNSSQDDSHVVQMALYSLDGRILFKSVGSLRLLNQQAENDFANLPSGVYLIQIADGEVRENLRIVRY